MVYIENGGRGQRDPVRVKDDVERESSDPIGVEDGMEEEAGEIPYEKKTLCVGSFTTCDI